MSGVRAEHGFMKSVKIDSDWVLLHAVCGPWILVVY